MKETLTPNLSHRSTLKVDDSLVVPNVSDKLVAFTDMPLVFATAMMVGFLEATCIECIAQHLDDNEHSVGIHIDVSHVAATPVGMTVLAEVVLLEVRERILVFRVRAEDEEGLIGEGLHKRAIIDTRKFNDRVAEKVNRHV